MPVFLVALAAVFAPIVVFLLLPASGMFLFFIPIWLVAAAIVLGVSYLVSGRRGVLTGSGVLAAIAAFSFLGPVVIQLV